MAAVLSSMPMEGRLIDHISQVAQDDLSRSQSPEASSIFDTSANDSSWATEPEASPAPRVMTRQQAMEVSSSLCAPRESRAGSSMAAHHGGGEEIMNLTNTFRSIESRDPPPEAGPRQLQVPHGADVRPARQPAEDAAAAAGEEGRDERSQNPREEGVCTGGGG